MGKTYTFNPIASNLDVTVKPATQPETDAGVITDKYVSPATLAGYSGGGGASSIVIIKQSVELNNSTPIDIPYPAVGKYIVESVIVTNASSNLSLLPETNINLTFTAQSATSFPNQTGATYATYDSVTPIEYLKLLFVPENYIKMPDADVPICTPAPFVGCNGLYIGEASTFYNTMQIIVLNPISSAETVDAYIKLLRIE